MDPAIVLEQAEVATPPLLVLALCAGCLLVGSAIFVYLWANTRNGLYGVIVALGLVGAGYVASEVAVIVAGLADEPDLGFQLHRAQALCAAAFIFLFPLFLHKLLVLDARLRRAAKAMWVAGLAVFAAIAIAAFAFPDSFLGLWKRPGEATALWNVGRGTPGPLYRLRDLLVAAFSLCGLGFMAAEFRLHRKSSHVGWTLAGTLIAIASGVADLGLALREAATGLFTVRVFSLFGLGLTAFVVLSMLGTMKLFVDRTREIERARKLESLGVLAGGIAHDFNNLLVGVVGNASIALESDKLEPEARGLVAGIQAAALRAKSLTRQLLTFSRGQAPVRDAASLAEIAEDAAAFLLRGSNVAARLDFPAKLPGVHADKDQLHQVVQNLVINAKEAMPGGGTVTLRAREERIGAAAGGLRPGRYVALEVSDEGPGIPEAARFEVFEPYYSTKAGGSGLGLAVCYSIIKAHEGSIEALGAPGGGALFRILLPVSEPAEGGAVPPRPVAPRFSGRALVMDDEPTIRDVARRMLARMGFEAEDAPDGEAAVVAHGRALAEGKPYALLVFDLTVPGGVGGEEALRRILAVDPLAKAIVSSGYSEDDVMADHRAHGFSAVARKPYTYEELRAAVEKALAPAPAPAPESSLA